MGVAIYRLIDLSIACAPCLHISLLSVARRVVGGSSAFGLAILSLDDISCLAGVVTDRQGANTLQ